MTTPQIASSGFDGIDLEDDGNFEHLLQQLQKLYSEIPDEKKAGAKYTFTDGWGGKSITVTCS